MNSNRAIATLLFFWVLHAPHALAEDPETTRARVAVREAVAKARDQAQALVDLAWPEGESDPRVARFAQKELVEFGSAAMPALRKAIRTVAPERQVEVVDTLIAASQQVQLLPPNYLPSLEDVLWFGTREAKLRVLPELSRFRYEAAVLPIIDSAVEDPEITSPCIRTLGLIRDDRARFFLETQLNEGSPRIREEAALALAMIGGFAKAPLTAAMRSDDRELRLVAVRALLPVADEEQITDLFDYATTHADDDPALARAVLESAQKLEEMAELRRQAEAASPGADF